MYRMWYNEFSHSTYDALFSKSLKSRAQTSYPKPDSSNWFSGNPTNVPMR